MTPIISFVGKSSSGKTTVMVGVITELKTRGYRVACIKHSSHIINMDQPEKDSGKYAAAGSETVFISTPGKVALIKNADHELDIQEILHLMGSNFDVVLVEGYHKSNIPKIEVYREELGTDLRCPIEQLSAIISDKPLNTDKPQFTPQDTKIIADFIENNFIVPDKGDTILFVNDRPIPLKSFVKDIIARVSMGLVSALNDIGEPTDIDISIRNKHEK